MGAVSDLDWRSDEMKLQRYELRVGGEVVGSVGQLTDGAWYGLALIDGAWRSVADFQPSRRAACLWVGWKLRRLGRWVPANDPVTTPAGAPRRTPSLA